MNASAPSDLTPRWTRWVLPAILGAPEAERDAEGRDGLPRSVRDWVVDVTLFALALLAAGALIFADASRSDPAPSGRLVLDGLLAVPALVSLWYRRRHPAVVGWLTVGLSLVSDAAFGCALVGLLTVGVRCRPLRTLQVAALEIAAGATSALIYGDGHSYAEAIIVPAVITVIVAGSGLYVRVRRELVLSLRERARRAEDEQRWHVREAQLAERGRIAREMHDALAHRISLLSVHAGALEFNPTASPEEIARAAGVIRQAARAAQEELRDVIGVLRTEDAVMTDDGPAPPQPTIADLGRLIEESRAAGMSLSLTNTLSDAGLSPTVGRAVYRLVQEALTNARKHAPGQLVRVTVAGKRRGTLRVEVINEPRVGAAGRAGASGLADPTPAGAAVADGGQVGSGSGLVGLGERIGLLGGSLDSGPVLGGGFRVSAQLPWSGSDEPAEIGA